MGREGLGPVETCCPSIRHRGDARQVRQECMGGLGSTVQEAKWKRLGWGFSGEGETKKGEHLKCE